MNFSDEIFVSEIDHPAIMLRSLLPLVFAFFLVDAAFSRKNAIYVPSHSEIDSIYIVLSSKNEKLPDADVFRSAMAGLQSIRDSHKIAPDIISIIDFTKPSTEKRFWVIDVKEGKVLHHTLVAHGKNSGDLFATRFSNILESKQSSLGLFVTGKTYTGSHGLSLKLHGVQPGINDRAEERSIVMHSADYVSDGFIKRTGRLGRSFGCPAIPVEDHKEIITRLANGSCLYIHHTSM